MERQLTHHAATTRKKSLAPLSAAKGGGGRGGKKGNLTFEPKKKGKRAQQSTSSREPRGNAKGTKWWGKTGDYSSAVPVEESLQREGRGQLRKYSEEKRGRGRGFFNTGRHTKISKGGKESA